MDQIFSTRFFSSYQSDFDRCFFIDFGHKKVKLDFCQLLALRHKLSTISIDEHFKKEHPGVEIVWLCNKSHLFVFSTAELIDLRELLKGTMGMLELNSLVSV